MHPHGVISRYQLFCLVFAGFYLASDAQSPHADDLSVIQLGLPDWLVRDLPASVTPTGPDDEISLLRERRVDMEELVHKSVRRMCVKAYADGLDKVRPNLGDSIRDHPLEAVASSKRKIVLAAGSGSTGTHSLQKALKLFGLNTAHYIDSEKKGKWAMKVLNILGGPYAPENDMDEEGAAKCRHKLRHFDHTSLLAHSQDSTLSSIDAILDTPVSELFIDMFLSFPRARVVLTTRPSDTWVQSRVDQDLDDAFVPMQEPCGLYLGFGRMVFNSTEIARLFDLNNRLIRCFVPKDQLLEMDMWEEPKERMSTMMTELGSFLGINKSDAQELPFPHLLLKKKRKGLKPRNRKQALLMSWLSREVKPMPTLGDGFSEASAEIPADEANE